MSEPRIVEVYVSWLNRGPDSSGEVWIGCKRLILKLSEVLSVKEVKGPYMHPNQRLIPIQKWYDTRDIQLTIWASLCCYKRSMSCTYASTTPVPALLHIHHKSRELGLSKYTLHFAYRQDNINGKFPTIYLNLEKDLNYLKDASRISLGRSGDTSSFLWPRPTTRTLARPLTKHFQDRNSNQSCSRPMGLWFISVNFQTCAS